MNQKTKDHLKHACDGKHPYYVLITCDEPAEDGEMQVEMSYSGDELLASYLLEGAQLHMQDQEPFQFAEEL